MISLGCSSDSDSNQDLDNDFGNFNFTMEDYFAFRDFNESGADWDEFINNDGSITYSLSSEVERVGNNPLFAQDRILIIFSFTVNSPIQVNQVIPIQNIDIFLNLPHNDLNYDPIIGCNRVKLIKKTTSSGFLKITEIDNSEEFIYGEFDFIGLGNADSGGGCQNYPQTQNFNIIDGTFKAFIW